ncbi:MAG: Mur ligase domain-containing protein [Candidatus Gracilibacteria bacterium]
MSFFEEHKKIHFIGIGGIGVSALARLCKARGIEVSGSDATASSITNELLDEEISPVVGHNAENLPEDADMVIYSEAVPASNVERVRAEELGVPAVSYFEALGEITEDYRLIAIAGSHGKTTVTAMLGLILERAGMDPTVVVGSKLKEFGNKNVRVGEYSGLTDLFVLEACEYRRDFLSLHPALLGVLNMDLDHTDYYHSQEDYEQAFHELAEQSEEVIWPEDVSEYEGEVGVPGDHNLMNAGMAAHLARRLGVPEGIIAESLKAYHGAWRRFEYKGMTLNGAAVYDDYAHHPTEIMATLAAAREKFPDERIVAVFQPHQYSRTRDLLTGFAQAFEDADEVIIPNIYAARDRAADKESISPEILVEEISKYHDNVRYGGGLEKTAEYLEETTEDGDLILVMGAGDVDQVSYRLTAGDF